MFSVGVVAHISRAEQAHTLQEAVGAVYLSMDDGALGCNANHKRVWEQLSHYDTGWSLVLEDDAVPVAGFTNQLEQALTAAPTPVVSLYLGQTRPAHYQRAIARAITKAEKVDASWIVTGRAIHAVGLAVRTELVPTMLPHTDDLPFDEAVSEWAHRNRLPVGYTYPSLVDHADTPSLVTHRYNRGRPEPPRTAWKTGARESWNSRTVGMA